MARKFSSVSSNKINNIFNQGEKKVFKTFVAFFIYSNASFLTIIASKKIGKAVKRNLARRRIKELVRDYPVKAELVIVCRSGAHKFDFSFLKNDWQNLIKHLEKSQKTYLNN